MDNSEINILTEQDLPYFEELEEKGMAVILRFPSMEAFAAFDLKAFLGDPEKKLSLEDVQKWIKEEAGAIAEEMKVQEELQKNIQQMQDATKIYLMIAGAGLSGREHSILMSLVQEGKLSEEGLETILDAESDKERRELINKAANETII